MEYVPLSFLSMVSLAMVLKGSVTAYVGQLFLGRRRGSLVLLEGMPAYVAGVVLIIAGVAVGFITYREFKKRQVERRASACLDYP